MITQPLVGVRSRYLRIWSLSTVRSLTLHSSYLEENASAQRPFGIQTTQDTMYRLFQKRIFVREYTIDTEGALTDSESRVFLNLFDTIQNRIIGQQQIIQDGDFHDIGSDIYLEDFHTDDSDID